jgi:hypothetical protein
MIRVHVEGTPPQRITAYNGAVAENKTGEETALRLQPSTVNTDSH